MCFRVYLICLSLLLILVSSQLTATAPENSTTTPPESSDEKLKPVYSLAITANAFRLAAAKDAFKAIQYFGDQHVQNKWEKEIIEYFRKENVYWNDYFNFSVVWIGRVQKNQGVIAFYNPWTDVIMLTAWNGPVGKQKLLDFKFVSGDIFRNEELKRQIRSPYWQREKSPVVISLAKQYNSTLTVFNSLYPLFGEFLLIPSDLKKRAAETEPSLLIMQTRLTDRITMFADYLKPKNIESPATVISSKINQIQKYIRNGDVNSILDYTSPKQKPELIQDVVQLREEVRATLFPVFYHYKENRAFVVLASPLWPKWFITCYFNISPKEIAVDTLELCELEIASFLVQEIETTQK